MFANLWTVCQWLCVSELSKFRDPALFPHFRFRHRIKRRDFMRRILTPALKNRFRVGVTRGDLFRYKNSIRCDVHWVNKSLRTRRTVWKHLWIFEGLGTRIRNEGKINIPSEPKVGTYAKFWSRLVSSFYLRCESIAEQFQIRRKVV